MEKIIDTLGISVLLYLAISTASYAHVAAGHDILYSPFWHGPIAWVIKMTIGGG